MVGEYYEAKAHVLFVTSIVRRVSPLRRSVEILVNVYPALSRWAKLCRASGA